jgi:hypothetical protein
MVHVRTERVALVLETIAAAAWRDAAELPLTATAGHRVSRSAIGYPWEDASPTSRPEAIAMVASLEAVFCAAVGADGLLCW